MTAPIGSLFTKVLNEGYCCTHAYLRLCRARGEDRHEMGANVGQSYHTICYHYKALKRGERPCLHREDCMLPIIEQIESEEKKPSEEG